MCTPDKEGFEMVYWINRPTGRTALGGLVWSGLTLLSVPSSPFLTFEPFSDGTFVSRCTSFLLITDIDSVGFPVSKRIFTLFSSHFQMCPLFRPPFMLNGTGNKRQWPQRLCTSSGSRQTSFIIQSFDSCFKSYPYKKNTPIKTQTGQWKLYFHRWD